MEKLFSYGTLQLPQVQESLFGRTLIGMKDVLRGYRVEELKIKDQAVIEKSGTDMHPILVKSDDPDEIVVGMIFEVTEEELARADDYEVDDYQRTFALMRSGNEAWIYSATKA